VGIIVTEYITGLYSVYTVCPKTMWYFFSMYRSSIYILWILSNSALLLWWGQVLKTQVMFQLYLFFTADLPMVPGIIPRYLS